MGAAGFEPRERALPPVSRFSALLAFASTLRRWVLRSCLPGDVVTGWLLREDVPKPVVSDRADVEVRVLDNHYDERSEIEKMEVRAEYIPDFD